jgi:hypothetical protein
MLGGEGIGDISDILPGSTIEANSQPLIYEDVMIDFAFGIFTAMSMQIMVLWIVTPYSSVRARRFGGTCSLHF